MKSIFWKISSTPFLHLVKDILNATEYRTLIGMGESSGTITNFLF